jgi:hypothetical protein
MMVIASNGHLASRSRFAKFPRGRISALFDTDTTADTQDLRYECDLVAWFDFYTQLACNRLALGSDQSFISSRRAGAHEPILTTGHD